MVFDFTKIYPVKSPFYVDGFFAQDTELAYLKPGFEATDFIRYCFEICLKKSKKIPGF